MTDFKRLFAVFSLPRCGSNYLCSLLGSHPLVGCHNEIFHPDEVGAYFPPFLKTDPLFNIEWRNHYPSEFLSRLLHQTIQHSPPQLKLVGCKLLLNEYQVSKGLDAILDTGAPIILLSRRNKLALYSSLYIASETGIWASSDTTNSQHKITFNKSSYLDFAELYQRIELDILEALEKRNSLYYKVDYNDLFNELTTSAILDFLKLPPAPMQASTAKQNTVNLLDRFSNPDDVLSFLSSIGKTSWASDPLM